MKKKLISLIDLKSIITLLLVITLITVVFANVAIEDEAIKAIFISTISSCFTYYFTKKGQGAKTEQSPNEEGDRE
ncbi:MAG: hypothetical protein E7400_06745 [Ruminococcaceae bacterium]|nr:hypothetical protein [Oscillospiraceae bacterium]